MIEQFYEQIKAELDDTLKALLGKFQEKFELFWKEYLEDLAKRKVEIEEEIAGMEGKKKELDELVDSYGKVKTKKEGIEKTIESLEERKKQIILDASKEQEGLEEIRKEKKQIETDRQAIKEERMMNKAEAMKLEEQRRSIKKMFDKING